MTVTLDTVATFAAVDSIPMVSVGGSNATGASQFSGIQGIHVDKARRIWVADGQSAELRIFDANGAHLKTRGGQGEGPGEFLYIRLLGAPRGDSVLIGDSGTDRITVCDPEGEFVRTYRLPGANPRPFKVFEDGSVLGVLPRIVAAASVQPGQVLRDSLQLARVGLDSTSLEPYGTAVGPLWLWTGRSQLPLPFTVNASFDVVASAVHLVSGPDFRIHVLEGGRLVESYGVQRQARTVGASDVEAYRVFVEEYIPEQMRPDYLAALDHEFRPNVLPAYDRVLAAADGHVWAQVYESDIAAPHEWDVFDTKRRFVGRVHVAAGFYPMAITTDALVGVWRDAMGVEHVRAYRFTRS
ncbi:MAG: 6-bladed beta-propeller [Longimicrobiales bacterium]